jgi:hypothetical protein
MRPVLLPVLAALVISVALPAAAVAADPPAKKRIILVGMDRDHGPGEHEYMAGLAVLAESLRRTPGVEPVVIKNWPEDPKVLEGTASIVCFLRAGGGYLLQPSARRAQVEDLMKQGTGFVALHWAVEGPKALGDPYMAILGGYYEPGYSDNPHNTTTVRPADPSHPIARGWKPFEARDEFYFKIRLLPGAKPAILAADLKGHDKKEYRDQIIGWTYERKEGKGPLGPGRSFGFTGCHFLGNFVIPEFRRLIVNGILWTADVPVPEKGAPL